VRRRLWHSLILALAVILLTASAAFAGSPGNNGTVKIHDGGLEPSPEIKNQPHVCTFHLHFFFADANQTGNWWIQSWPPTGKKTTVMSGTYATNADGEYRTPASPNAYRLDPGHYKLFWQGRNDKNIKHKVFWVTCETPPPPPCPATPLTSGTANVDGNPAEWNLTADFVANLYKDGNSSSPVEAKLYLRYDSAGDVLYAFVKAQPGVVLQTIDPAEDYLSTPTTGKIVHGLSGDNGVAPDFAWVGLSAPSATGFEASGLLGPGTYDLRVHAKVPDGSADGYHTLDIAGRYKPLTICP
jgi:hypothetical protein